MQNRKQYQLPPDSSSRSKGFPSAAAGACLVIIRVLPGVWLEISDTDSFSVRFSMWFYCNAYGFFFPPCLANSAVSRACSSWSQQGWMSVFSPAVRVQSSPAWGAIPPAKPLWIGGCGWKACRWPGGFLRSDVPYRVPDSGGQHSQINERKPG